MAVILVVEDDADLVGLLVHALKGAGHVPRVATDGIQALSLAREFKPALIVLDYMFPAGGGGSFHKRLRMSSHTSGTPILLLTAVPEAVVMEAIGPDEKTRFMGKPYHKDDFLKVVAEMLG